MQNYKDKIIPTLIAALPLILLATLVTMFSYSVKNYILCRSEICEPLSKIENLSKILVPDITNAYSPAPGDTDEIKRSKEIRNNKRDTSIYGGRVSWSFLKMVYVFTCFLALGISCFVIYSSFAQINTYPIAALLIALVFALVLGIYLSQNPETYQSLLKPLSELTIDADTKQLPETMILVNSFGFSICLLLTLASCSVLFLWWSNLTGHETLCKMR